MIVDTNGNSVPFPIPFFQYEVFTAHDANGGVMGQLNLQPDDDFAEPDNIVILGEIQKTAQATQVLLNNLPANFSRIDSHNASPVYVPFI